MSAVMHPYKLFKEHMRQVLLFFFQQKTSLKNNRAFYTFNGLVYTFN